MTKKLLTSVLCRVSLLLLSAAGPASSLCGQNTGAPSAIGEIPDAYTRSADSLALYIDTHHRNEEAKLQALYTWLTTHMTYNVYPTFVPAEERNDEAREIRETLRLREGVCRQFAKVFEAVGNRMDIPVWFVEGYVKSNGAVMSDPHAWCVARVDGKWFCYDPTFGMGYIRNYQFVSAPNTDYCRMAPETFIRTHMPFDPIFQLLEYPLSYQAFDDSSEEARVTDGAPCRFADSIRVYMRQSPAEQLVSTNRRMMRNGRPNRLVDYCIQINTSNISVYRCREVYNVYKTAIKHYNRSTDLVNEMIRHERSGFKPKRQPSEIDAWLQGASAALLEADNLMQNVGEVPAQYLVAVNNLKESIGDLMGKIHRHEEILAAHYGGKKKKK